MEAIMPEKYRHGRFGTARLLSRRNKWLLLKCIRETTVKANRGRRYVQVSRAFFQLRQIIEYKARRAGHAVMLIDPADLSPLRHGQEDEPAQERSSVCVRELWLPVE